MLSADEKLYGQWFRDFLEESDRGCILVAHSILDENLEGILRQHFARCSPGERELRDNILRSGGFGLLGMFARRVSISCALGLITKNTADALRAVNDLRVPFAHYQKEKNKPRQTKLRSENLKEIMGKLTPVELFMVGRMHKKFASLPRRLKQKAHSRERGMFSVLILLLLYRLSKVYRTPVMSAELMRRIDVVYQSAEEYIESTERLRQSKEKVNESKQRLRQSKAKACASKTRLRQSRETLRKEILKMRKDLQVPCGRPFLPLPPTDPNKIPAYVEQMKELLHQLSSQSTASATQNAT
ncbi:MAG: hypothetical protein WCB27_21430 [Thermoguttaceae bacterium]